MYNYVLELILIFTYKPILFHLFSLKTFKRFDLVRDWNRLLVCLFCPLMLMLVFLFREVFLLSPESFAGEGAVQCVQVSSAILLSLLLPRLNQEDLTQWLFFVKCTECQGCHELKQAVVVECFAAKWGVCTPFGKAVGQRGSQPGQPCTRPPSYSPGSCSRTKFSLTPFYRLTSSPSFGLWLHTDLRGGEAAVAVVQAASGRRAGGGFHNVQKALVTSYCVGGLSFTHRT